MKTFVAFTLALTIMIAGAASVLLLRTNQKLGSAGVKVVSSPILDEEKNIVGTQSVALPEQVFGFESEPLPISKQELKFLPKDTTYGRRLYRNRDDFHIMASVVLMGTDRTSIHKPEFCLPGQGWSIISQEVTDIKIDGTVPYNLQTMRWTIGQKTVGKDGKIIDLRGNYVFWFVSGSNLTPHHSGRINSMVKNLITRGELERWAYVTYFATCAPGQEETTFSRMKEFIAASVPEFQLTTGKPRASETASVGSAKP